jgi:hypothetical protein
MGTAVMDTPLRDAEWPQIARCQACHAEVLLAVGVDGSVFVLSPWPVIVGPARCSACKGKGRRLMAMYATGGRRSVSTPGDLAEKMTKGSLTACPECRGTGERGERLTREHVVMTHGGVCRRWQRFGGPWDSAYRLHVCGTGA